MKRLSIFLSFLVLLATIASAQTQPSPSPKPVPAPETEPKITPEQAKELFRSVDEIIKFASERTLLPVKQPVKKAMVSREDVEKYVNDKFAEDVDRIRFERSELVLKKFGLLPRKFDLHTFLVKLLGEQVAGYYDEKTKAMNLLNWVEFDMQKPVMAHELTHALQDQSFDLGKLMHRDDEVEKRGAEDPNTLIKVDEASTCRSAVMEGQAMVVLVDYVLVPTGHNSEDSPKLFDLMAVQMTKMGESPLFDNAPLLLQEELMFPYRDGMQFIHKLLEAGGKKLAYSGVLERMPETTREIMMPQEYLAGHRVPPVLLPDLKFLKKSYEPFDAGAVGQLDVNILLRQYADNAIATRLTPEWRGGAYYAAGQRKAKPTDPTSTAHIGLLYVSKWSSDAAAKDFAGAYSSALGKRYTGLQHLAADPAKPGLDKYSSADGPIFIQQTGNVVVAVESFDEANAGLLIVAALKQAQ